MLSVIIRVLNSSVKAVPEGCTAACLCLFIKENETLGGGGSLNKEHVNCAKFSGLEEVITTIQV